MVTSPSSPVVPSSPESPPFTTAPPFLQPKHTRRPPQRRSIVPKTRIYDPRDIEQPIQNVRETILRTIISEYEDFLAVYVPVSSIEEDLQEIKEKLATCSENDPHVKSLSYKLETLTSLFKAHSLITALSSLLDTADIRGAAVKAAELLDLMEDLPTREMVPDERPALELLKSARTRYVSKLRHTLRSLLISAIRIHKPSPTSVELSIRTRVLGTHARTYYEDPVDLMDAWVAAETVGGVTRQLGDVITKAVADELIVKIVEGGIKVTSGGGRMNMWIKVEPEKGPKAYGGAAVARALTHLASFTSFVSAHFPALDSSREYITFPIWQSIWASAAKAVEAAAPTATLDLNSFVEQVAESLRVLEKVGRDCGLVTSGMDPTSDLLSSLPAVSMRKRREDTLALARDVLSGDPDATVRVSESTERGGLPSLGGEKSSAGGSKGGKSGSGKGGVGSSTWESEPGGPGAGTFRLPTMQVTVAAQAVIEMAYATVDEAKGVAVKPGGANEAAALYRLSRDLIDLLRAMIPGRHQTTRETAPVRAIVHCNDCIYTAWHLTTMRLHGVKDVGGVIGEWGTFADMVVLFRQLAEEMWESELTRQRDTLLAMFAPLRAGTTVRIESATTGGAESVNRTEGSTISDGVTTEWLEAVESGVRVSAHQMDVISRVWKNVLPPREYLKAVGALLDAVLEDLETHALVPTVLKGVTGAQMYQLGNALGAVATRAAGWFEVPDEGGKMRKEPIEKHASRFEAFTSATKKLGGR